MSSNAITEFTRRDLFDHLRISGISWCGQKSKSDFLERVFTISKLPSNDYRASTMEGDVHLHGRTSAIGAARIGFMMTAA